MLPLRYGATRSYQPCVPGTVHTALGSLCLTRQAPYSGRPGAGTASGSPFVHETCDPSTVGELNVSNRNWRR
jgi:hypothetical protein